MSSEANAGVSGCLANALGLGLVDCEMSPSVELKKESEKTEKRSVEVSMSVSLSKLCIMSSSEWDSLE